MAAPEVDFYDAIIGAIQSSGNTAARRLKWF